GQQCHRFDLARTRRLVDDNLQPRQLGLDERTRQDVQAGRINRRFEDRMARAIEADELPSNAAVHDESLDPGAWRRTLKRSNLEFPPRTAIGEDDAADVRRRHGWMRRVR